MPRVSVIKCMVIAGWILAGGSAWVGADGKFFFREKVPTGIPYQRALIIYGEGKETLVLQSKYEIKGPEAQSTQIGWVVPVLAEPELSSTPAEDAVDLFSYLSTGSKPRIHFVSFILMRFLAVWSALLLIVYACSYIIKNEPVLKKHRFMILMLSFGAAVICSIWVFFSMSLGGASGVEIIEAKKVGIYNVKVIKSQSSEDIINWLNENGFVFDMGDKPIFERYIQEGWCFTVARVGNEEEAKKSADNNGLVDPLILRFKAAAAVYPLALTGTVGADTEVLIYLLAEGKMDCGGRLKMRFAGEFDFDKLVESMEKSRLKKEAYFTEGERRKGYLCKFKGILKPEQMREDIVFRAARDNKAYRENMIKW